MSFYTVIYNTSVDCFRLKPYRVPGIINRNILVFFFYDAPTYFAFMYGKNLHCNCTDMMRTLHSMRKVESATSVFAASINALYTIQRAARYAPTECVESIPTQVHNTKSESDKKKKKMVST